MTNKSSRPIQLDARFARYALLTGATILAGKTAKANVIFTVVSPTDFTSGTHTLDVNGDGIPDYVFSGLGTSPVGVLVDGFSVVTVSSSFANTNFTGSFSTTLFNQIAFDGSETGIINALAFGTGEVIGTSLSWDDPVSGVMSAFSATGPLFLGLEIYDTNGLLHYGFAEFDPFMLEGFAFETTPNTAIITFDVTAPEPGSLGMLALGAAGLEMVRRKRANRA